MFPLKVQLLLGFNCIYHFQNWLQIKCFTYDSGFQINKHCSRDVLSCTRLAEKCVKGVVSASEGLIAGHFAIGLDAVLQTVKLPARVADLYASLADVDRDTLTLREKNFLISSRTALFVESFLAHQ